MPIDAYPKSLKNLRHSTICRDAGGDLSKCTAPNSALSGASKKGRASWPRPLPPALGRRSRRSRLGFVRLPVALGGFGRFLVGEMIPSDLLATDKDLAGCQSSASGIDSIMITVPVADAVHDEVLQKAFGLDAADKLFDVEKPAGLAHIGLTSALSSA